MAVWGKLYGTLHGSPKWVACTKGARALWATALSWCIDQEASEGVVPEHMLRRLDGTKAEARCLVEVGLWEPVAGGWYFHDWEEHQRTRDKINADRAAAAERQQRARERRRDAEQGHGGSHAVTHTVSHTTRGEERREELPASPPVEGSPPVVDQGEPSSSSSPHVPREQQPEARRPALRAAR